MSNIAAIVVSVVFAALVLIIPALWIRINRLSKDTDDSLRAVQAIREEIAGDTLLENERSAVAERLRLFQNIVETHGGQTDRLLNMFKVWQGICSTNFERLAYRINAIQAASAPHLEPLAVVDTEPELPPNFINKASKTEEDKPE